jgi:hypothetical protein
MLPIPRSALVAAASVAAGGALYGAAAGGMVGIDRDLQAAAAPAAKIQTVEFRQATEPRWRDCHARGRDGQV